MNYPGNNIKGWMTPKELQWLYERAKMMRAVVEVGAWLGRSTHALLSGCPGTVYVVDDWKLGEGGLTRRQAFGEFLQNVGAFKHLQSMRMSSIRASKAFQDGSVDMVFLDAAHDYDSVMADLEAWKPKVTKLICGHDYSKVWPGVVQAVDEFFQGSAKIHEAIWYKELA